MKKRFVKMIRNFIEYVRKGGIVYMNFAAVDYPQMLENKHFVICGGCLKALVLHWLIDFFL